MRDLNELNIHDGGGDPVLLPPPSNAAIAAFEAEIGMPLPEELKNLLRFSNGGCPELDSVHGGEGESAVDHFFHLTEKGMDTSDDSEDGDEDTESLWYAIKAWRSIVGPQYIPFAATGGGDPFLLDVSVTPHSVKICRHDENMGIYEVAPSFEAFIDSLALNPNYH